jgi:hypothetical protein
MSIAFLNRARVTETALALVAGLAIPALVASSTAAAAASSVRVPRYSHIYVIMFTDHDYNNILHNEYAPTFNGLATEYGLATRYYTTSDPDTAGIMAFLAGNSYGVDDHAPYWDQRISKPSLLSQLDHAHKSWKEYVQDIPYAGYLGDCYPTACQETDSLCKQAKFNPVPDFTYIADNPALARRMVPLPTCPPTRAPGGCRTSPSSTRTSARTCTAGRRGARTARRTSASPMTISSSPGATPTCGRSLARSCPARSGGMATTRS